MLKTKVPEARVPEAGCQAGVTYSTDAKFYTCGVPNKSAFLSFYSVIVLYRCALSLSKPRVAWSLLLLLSVAFARDFRQPVGS
jgi:hypothetical protein